MTRYFATILAIGVSVSGLSYGVTFAAPGEIPASSTAHQDRVQANTGGASASQQSCGNIVVRMEEGKVVLTASCWAHDKKSDHSELDDINKKPDVRTN